MYFFCLLLLLFFLAYVYKLKSSRLYKMVFKFPAFSLEWPIVGSCYNYFKDSEGLMEMYVNDSNRIRKLGGAARFFVLNTFYIVLTDASDLAVALKNVLDKDYIASFMCTVTGHGSAFAPASIAKDRRQAIKPSFNLRTLYSYVDIFWEESINLTEILAPHAGAGVFSIEHYLGAFNLGTFLRTTMIVKDDEQDYRGAEFLKHHNRVLDITNERLYTFIYHPDFLFKFSLNHFELKQCKKILKEYSQEIMKKRMDRLKRCKQSEAIKDSNEVNDAREGIIDSLLTSKLDDISIAEEILILLGANDLTGIALGFTLMLLGLYPSVQDKVYQELQGVFGNSNRPLVKDDLSKLKYLEMVIKESLRLYPPSPIITRQSTKDVVLPSGKIFPAGAGLFVLIVGLHRDPKYWGSDAECFDPERFSPERLKNVHPNAFMPFGHASRSCIGFNYGQILIKTAICAILRRFRIVGKPASGPIPDIKTKIVIFMKAANNFEIEIVNRN